MPKQYKSRGGRPPRLYEALVVAHQAAMRKKGYSFRDQAFVAATLEAAEQRQAAYRDKKSARLRAPEEAGTITSD